MSFRVVKSCSISIKLQIYCFLKSTSSCVVKSIEHRRCKLAKKLIEELRKHLNEEEKSNSLDLPTPEQKDLSSFATILADDGEELKALQSLLFDFDVIKSATDGFSDANKLGRGGFGSVYKGKFMDGQEIAVKRLSENSAQGVKEFKNEVLLISKLQHRNLVRLLGCCIYGKERLLLYEFMPNKSLDGFLFAPSKHGVLDWAKRNHIIEGIARGLLYLHRDSRLKIIHRDMKASNILLDEHFSPKIADFGLARYLARDQNLETTRKVVGTFGYISPEYAMEGLFSEKSDVFSFGVLILEVVSGKRNNCVHDEDGHLNLLGYAWTLWIEDRILELIDPSLGDSWVEAEVMKCIKVGLLCVQEFAEDRPNMSSVVMFLNSSDYMDLPSPKQAAFFGGRNGVGSSSTTIGSSELCSANGLTCTGPESR